MRRIAILNQKGGVGKTTTSVNLGAALARAGKSVCILDLDPRPTPTTHLGIEPDGQSPSMYEVLIDNRPLAEVRRQADENLWVVGSDINLAAAEVELAGVVGREVILRDLLQQDADDARVVRFHPYGLRPVARRLDAQRPVRCRRSVHSAAAALSRPARPEQIAGDDRPGQQAASIRGCG